MCRLRNIATRDYQDSVTTGQKDAGQSDPYVPLCFAGDTKTSHCIQAVLVEFNFERGHHFVQILNFGRAWSQGSDM